MPNRIGAKAEKIIAVHFAANKQLYANVRKNGALVKNYTTPQSFAAGETITVEATSGYASLTMVPPIWQIEYDDVSIGLTAASFNPNEVAPAYSAGGSSAATRATKVVLKAKPGLLEWKVGGSSGAWKISKTTYPEVAISLRLPADSKGYIKFSKARFDGAAILEA
jgi:hypothetical protein